MAEEPAEYEVEEILDKKTVNGKDCYYIKWKGYPGSENTWEPRHNLTHCNFLLKKFERGKGEKKGKQGKRKSAESSKLQSEKEKVAEIVPKAIVGIRKRENGKLEYAVELDNKKNPDSPLVVACTSEYLAEKCPALLITYLEQHISLENMPMGQSSVSP